MPSMSCFVNHLEQLQGMSVPKLDGFVHATGHKVSAIFPKGHPINGKHMGDNCFYLPVLLRLPEFQMRITSATYQYFPVRKVGKGKYGVSMAIQSKQGFPILQIEYHHTMVARTYRQVLL